jgi:hypothetical protein
MPRILSCLPKNRYFIAHSAIIIPLKALISHSNKVLYYLDNWLVYEKGKGQEHEIYGSKMTEIKKFAHDCKNRTKQQKKDERQTGR